MSNCGAPLQNNKCEYCGTIFVDDAVVYYTKQLKQKNINLQLAQELINSKIIQGLNKGN